MNRKHTVSSVVLVAALAGATGCGAQSGPAGSVPEETSPGAASTAQAPATAGATAEAGPTGDAEASGEAMITISDFDYEVPGSVGPGATVTVVNEDSVPHTVTAQDEGGFDVEAPAGETVTFTAPEEPGEYEIICTYHPQMSGTLVVQ